MKKLHIVVLIIILVVIATYKKEVISEIKYINRETGRVEVEKVPGEAWLKWLYYNPLGNLTTKTIVKNRFVSAYYGRLMDKKKSKDKIEAFVKEFDIDLSEAREKEFNNFNEFFWRKLKEGARPIDNNPNRVASPADGKILWFEDLGDVENFFVKGSKFDLATFVQKSEWVEKYRDASMTIIRLCPADYHRYHFPISGLASEEYRVEGDYYSVSPYAVKENIKIYFENKRSLTEVVAKDRKSTLMVEVGATMVGGVLQTYSVGEVEKGEEKGYFKFGGSTVVLLFEKGSIDIDEDIAKNSREGLETKIYMGEGIGTFVN